MTLTPTLLPTSASRQSPLFPLQSYQMEREASVLVPEEDERVSGAAGRQDRVSHRPGGPTVPHQWKEPL